MTNSTTSIASASPLVALRTRRAMLAMGAGAMAAAVAGGRIAARAQDATPEADLPALEPNCAVTPEQTSGPYYLPGQAIRQEIAEDRPGIPFRLRIGVTDAAACAMLPGVAVEIWHCDADAIYSGVDGAAGSPTFLRGVQVTDDDGVAEFHTIYPGWYPGRTPHIHLAVHIDGAAGPAADDPQAATTDADAETYQGGRSILVGQVYLDDAVSDVVYALPPYDRRDAGQRTRNDQDRFFGSVAGEPGVMIAVQPVDDADWTQGLIGTVVLGVNTGA
jgi:protocatechuate 3,4-dioxygenase beta subunit